MFVVVVAIPLFIVLIVGAASAMLARRAWRERSYLAPVWALVGIGIVAQAAWITYWLSSVAGVVLSIAVVVMAIGVLVVSRCWTLWRSWLPLVAVTIGIAAFVYGFVFLWGGLAEPFVSMQNRFRSMPVDNAIQYFFADLLWKHQPTTIVVGDWHGSDRPPLQSGILLLIRPFETLFGVAPLADASDPLAQQFGAMASLASQLLWIPAAFALVRSLGFRPTTTLVTVVFVAIVPVTMFNTSFTWPKMLSAAFALAAIALLADAIRRRDRVLVPVVTAAVLAVLAFLSHGGAAFAIPIFLTLAVVLVYRSRLRTVLTAIGAAAAAAIVVYAPWIAYGTFADPSNGRLLKWHLAGFIPPDDTSFLHDLVTAYTTTPIADLVRARVVNLQRIADFSFVTRFDTPDLTGAREQDFFSTPWAAGLGTPLTIAFVVVALYCLIRRIRPNAQTRLLRLLLVSATVSLVLWGLVMFIPDGAVVHQGSYIWLMLFAALPFAWLYDRQPFLAVILLTIQAGYTVIVYTAPAGGLFTNLSAPHLVIAALGAVVVVAALLASAVGSARPPTPPPFGWRAPLG